ncbi:MAG: hypothetical protein HOJ35_05920 [Bdellovibrionales bacterium]|nr:hypothetical protein [Bdellovibrionales bacterium]
MNIPPVIYKGSVKNILADENFSNYIFEFSDRFSVFDWGDMDDQLPEKGKSLAIMAYYLFQYLENPLNWKDPDYEKIVEYNNLSKSVYNRLCTHGLNHHCKAILSKGHNSLQEGTYGNYLLVSPVNVIRPHFTQKSWDYNQYKSKPENTLVPLEVIFRFGTPKGSSLFERIKNNSYCQEIGLKDIPKVGDKFDYPIIEFSTKLEHEDRYISYNEAIEIAGLNIDEFQALKSTAILTAVNLKNLFKKTGIELLDGKLEFAFATKKSNERTFMLVDSIGPDELRLEYNNTPLSKECLRTYYRSSNWFKTITKAKEYSNENNINNWKQTAINKFNATPPSLNPDLQKKISTMYKVLSNELTELIINKHFFSIDDDLQSISGQLKKENQL